MKFQNENHSNSSAHPSRIKWQKFYAVNIKVTQVLRQFLSEKCLYGGAGLFEKHSFSSVLPSRYFSEKKTEFSRKRMRKMREIVKD